MRQESPSRGLIKLKKELAAAKKENKVLTAELEQSRNETQAAMKGDGATSDVLIAETQTLRAELHKYKELEELSRERDDLIQQLGADNEGAMARLAQMEAENTAKDNEIDSLRSLISELEEKQLKKVESFGQEVVASAAANDKEKDMVIRLLQADYAALDDRCKQLQQQLVTKELQEVEVAAHVRQLEAAVAAAAGNKEEDLIFQQLQADHAALGDRCKQLQQQLVTKELQEVEVADRVRQLEVERDDAVKALRAVQASLTALETQKRGQVSAHEQQLRELSTAKDAAESASQVQQAQVASLQTEMRELSSKLITLDKETDEIMRCLTAERDAAVATCEDLQGRLADTQGQLADAQSTVQAMETELATTTAKLEDAAAALSASASASAVASGTASGTADGGSSRSAEDEELIASLIAARKDAEARALLLEGNVASLQSMLTQLEVKSEQQTEKEEKAEKGGKGAKKGKGKKGAAVDQADENVEQQLFTAAAEKKDVEDRYTQLEGQVDGLKTLIKDLEVRNHATSGEHEELRMLVEVKDQQISTLIGERNDAQEELKVASQGQEERGAMDLQVKQLQSELAAATDRSQRAEARCVELEEEIATAQAQAAEQRRQFEAAQEDVRRDATSVSDATSKLVHLQETVATLEEEKRLVHERVVESDEALTRECAHVQTTNARVHALQGQLEEISTAAAHDRAAVVAAQQAHATLEAHLQTLVDEKAALAERVQALVHDNASAGRSTAKAAERLAVLEGALGAAESRAAAAEEALQTARQEASALGTQAAKVDTAEAQLQERIVENAALHERLRDVTDKLKATQDRLVRSEVGASEAQEALAAVQDEGEARIGLMVQQLETALEEVNFVKEALEAAQAEVMTTQAALSAAQQECAGLRQKEVEYTSRLEAGEEATRRAQEAEDALSKVEDKKRRDLENLKKQNERISLIQKAAAEADRLAQEQIGDLRASLDVAAAKTDQLERALAERERGEEEAQGMIRDLQGLLAAARQEQEKQSETLPSPAAAAEAAAAATPARAPAPAQSLPGDLARIDELQSTVSSLHQQIAVLDQAAALAKLAVATTHKAPGGDPATAAVQEELHRVAGLYHQATQRVAALEEERGRLEREAKEMSRSLAASISSPHSSSTQRQRTGGDVESGGKESTVDADQDDVDKKGEAGINPVVNAWLVQAWTSIRFACPAALPYIGDRPPRLGLISQGIMLYVLLLHLFLFLSRCPVCQSAPGLATPQS